MAHYQHYRDRTLALDDLAADLESLLTAYDNERFELNKSLELARAHEGVNLILSSTNVRRGHCCPDADGRFVTEYDREARACRCDQRDAAEPNRKSAPVIHRVFPSLVPLSHLRQPKPAHLCQMVAQLRQMTGSEHELGPHICATWKRGPSTARRPPVGVRHQLDHRPSARNGPGPVHSRQSERRPSTPHQETHDAYPPRRKPSPLRRLQIVPVHALRVARDHCEILQPGHDRDPQMGPGQQGAGPRMPPRHVRCRRTS